MPLNSASPSTLMSGRLLFGLDFEHSNMLHAPMAARMSRGTLKSLAAVREAVRPFG
jgi:hypothetical protein